MIIESDHLIGAIPVGEYQREDSNINLVMEHSVTRYVRVWPNTSNAWNQNWNSGNPGNQNNNNKNNTNSVRAVRRLKG
jgi:hypothetical protein